MKTALALLLLSSAAFAQSVKEKKARDHVNQNFADSTSKVNACGKQFKFVYDWKAFDSVDFAKASRDKQESYGLEASNVMELGDGINALCGDKDYKEALGKISTIVYKPTANDTITVKATVAAGTLTFENYMFGSTRGSSDYQQAAKDAL